MDAQVRRVLDRGVVVPACPLALTARRTLDERRQRALCRYYAAAGAGGLAVAVHTTQFAIRDPKVGLLEPVLALAAEELTRADRRRDEPLVRIAGVCGGTQQAEGEAELARRFGYHAILVSLAALKDAGEDRLFEHCRILGRILPLIGFYLQPAVGGRVLPYSFWRRFLELDAVAAIKIAPFNRYQTLDVVRAVIDSGRDDVALYTGNDDQIVFDLLTPFRFVCGGRVIERRIVGGLLGHWAVWTRRAVELLAACHAAARAEAVPAELLRCAVEVTDSNAAFFDAANNFAGCIAGLHEVLRRQGLFGGTWCLDPAETLSPGQVEEIERIYRCYPHWNDDDFIATGRDEWLRP
jgi:dihydrodipicolinate synthase/N-acetylneuraminate lyase